LPGSLGVGSEEVAYAHDEKASRLAWILQLSGECVGPARRFCPKNILYLADDVGHTVQGPLAPGSSASIQNSQCILNGSASSASGTGDELTLGVSLVFKSTWSGSKNIYVKQYDVQGGSTNWTPAGNWIVP